MDERRYVFPPENWLPFVFKHDESSMVRSEISRELPGNWSIPFNPLQGVTTLVTCCCHHPLGQNGVFPSEMFISIPLKCEGALETSHSNRLVFGSIS